MKIFFVFSLVFSALLLSNGVFAQQDGWQLFKKARFSPAYPKAMKSNLFDVSFGEELLAHKGKEIVITGYVVPHDTGAKDVLILSAKPFAQCFFCGGAGPETIAEVYLKGGYKAFPQDKLLTVRGKLYLNDTDPTHMYFWVKDAVLVN
jgi:hypothetical protein